MPVSKNTAMDIALAYREVETAEKLLSDILKAKDNREAPDMRDAFGRRHDGLQLGVPRGESSQTLFNVPWAIAIPIIQTHIAQQQAIIATLSEKAKIEVTEAQP